MTRRVCLFFAAILAAAQGAERPPDLILHNGRIITVDQKFSIAEAIAIQGERIAAVGSNEAILKLAGPATRKIDLLGKTVMPGLIDSHAHPTGASMHEFDHTVPEMDTIADVLEYVRSRAAALGPGQWIRVSQIFITRLKEQRYPTREELDRAAPQNPVVFSTGPDAVLNSAALKASGIDRNFKVPEGMPTRVEKDPKTGEPTGVIRRGADLIKASRTGKRPTFEDRLSRLRQLMADYNSVGITGVVSRTTSDDEVRLFAALKDRGQLTCRSFLTYSIDAQAPLEEIARAVDKAVQSPLHRYDNLLWLRGAKIFLDGGMLTGSAYMRQPWGLSKIYSITDPEYRGLLFVQPEKLHQIARLVLRKGLQLTAHAQGDGAILHLVEAYEKVNREFSVKDARPCVSHGSFMSLEAIDKMRQLGVVADLQPAWLERDGATLLEQFGNDRLRYFHPYKTLAERGVVVGGGSDHMQKIGSMRSINPYNPFFGMWITLARQPRWMKGALHPEERLTREQAIRLYTSNNAFLTFEEKEKGSLEAGKLADLIVLDRDILTCPLDEVKEIGVEQTWLGGKRVHPTP